MTLSTADAVSLSDSTSLEICVVAYGSAAFASTWVKTAVQLGGRLAVADNELGSPSLLAVERIQSLPGSAATPVRTIGIPDNPGFGAASNILAHGSSATWLLFLNPDAHVTLWPFASKTPRTATIYGANQHKPDGTPIHSAGRSWTVTDEIKVAWFRKHPEPPKATGYVSGGAMLIEREFFLRLGGFDENFFLFYEDIDLCFRASKAGGTVWVIPGFDVEHDLGHATRKDWPTALQTSFESGDHFHRKHQHPVLGYRLFVTIDSMLRTTFYGVNRDSARRTGYARLTRSAMRALVTGKPPKLTKPS